jgi:hypothetical protein
MVDLARAPRAGGPTVHKLAATLLLVLLALPSSPSAQQPPQPAPVLGGPEAGAAPTGPKWYDTIELHGLVDTYFAANLGQQQAELNTLRLFDATNGFQLSYAKISTLLPASPVGFRLDVGLGQTAGILNFKPPGVAGVGDTTVQQAFVTLKFPGDIAFDAGRFVTAVGAEVIEAKDNWLYSRSILFDFAIPFEHIGIRATVPIRSVQGLSAMASLLNGWDNPPGPVGSKKVGHGALIYNGPRSTTAVLNVLYGYMRETSPDARLLIDAVLGRAFGDLTLNLNSDWAHEAGNDYFGISLMARYSVFDIFRITARGEFFTDPNGLALGLANGKYYEGTLGLSLPLGDNAELRLEGRHDHSNIDVFKGGQAGGQTTIEMAALAWF